MKRKKTLVGTVRRAAPLAPVHDDDLHRVTGGGLLLRGNNGGNRKGGRYLPMQLKVAEPTHVRSPALSDAELRAATGGSATQKRWCPRNFGLGA
jgi:hypothetical protein